MRRFLVPMILLLAAGRVPAAERVLVGARAVDPVTAGVFELSLHVRDGVVVAVGDSVASDLPVELERTHLRGALLLPALVDLRVRAGEHRSPGHRQRFGIEGTARLALAGGVTGFVDLHLPETAAYRERQRSTGAVAARAFVGGPVITVPRGVGSELPGALLIEKGSDAAALVDRLVDRAPEDRPDLLDVVFDRASGRPSLEVEALSGLLARARERGIEVVVDVGDWRDVHDALGAGATWLARLPDEPLPETVRERIGATRPRWTPLLAMTEDFVALVRDDSLRAEPMLVRQLAPELIGDYPAVRIPQSRFGQAGRALDARRATLRELDALGVRWRAGSETGALGTATAWSLHRELESWARAGLPPAKVLAAACVDGPAELGLRHGFSVGCRADYLVLATDPLVEVQATRELGAMVVGGELVDVEVLAAGVVSQLSEESPSGPTPPGGRWTLFVLVVVGFALLLVARRAIRHAAARAIEDEG